LTGTHTIGSGGNFFTLRGALDALNYRGVSGNVVFEFIDKNYNISVRSFFGYPEGELLGEWKITILKNGLIKTGEYKSLLPPDSDDEMYDD